MKDITHDFGTLYHPFSALVFYQTKGANKDTYVEYFDMDSNGHPVNAHPLTLREATALAKTLHSVKEKHCDFLKPKGILPTNVLQIIPGENGSALWYTKKQQTQMLFTQNLGIPNGKAEIPPMLWKANRQNLMVFALTSNGRPTEKTILYHAPFFNMYEGGTVCLGTVDVNISKSASLEEFIKAWENYFFNSYFSHLINEHNPIKNNCVNLWKNLVNTGKAFPKEYLKTTNRTLKNLLP